MNIIAELLGDNDAHWMSHPDKPCAPPSDAALDIRYHADRWFTGKCDDQGARKLCRGCPVINSCLSYALADPSLEGIFGGTTESGRRKLRKGAAA